MGVHWGGYPLDLDKIRDIRIKFREKNGCCITLIEDDYIHLVLSTKESI